MDRTRLEIAKADIRAAVEGLGKAVLSRADFELLLKDNRAFWRAGDDATTRHLIAFLLEEMGLREVRLKFPSRTVLRYTIGEASAYSVAASINPEAYLTHYSAMHLHGLTAQVPKTIYVNAEQSPKPASRDELTQDRIDAAFRRPARRSKNVARFGDYEICQLSGKCTGRLGVTALDVEGAGRVAVTNVERTLIDIAVRPAYAGGVFEVLEAYRRARDELSVNRLAATLKKLDYRYPYHQAIGYYLERSGAYRESQIRLMRKPVISHDFYLAHKMGETDYCKAWRLFIPKGM